MPGAARELSSPDHGPTNDPARFAHERCTNHLQTKKPSLQEVCSGNARGCSPVMLCALLSELSVDRLGSNAREDPHDAACTPGRCSLLF